MIGILYLSRASFDFEAETLRELRASASARNKQLGIAGYLCYEEGKFIQYIEGEPEIVNKLMGRISKDPRHRVLNTLVDDNLHTRRFPQWNMRWLHQSHFVGVEQLLSDYLLLWQAWERQAYQRETILRLLDTLSESQSLLAFCRSATERADVADERRA